MFPNLRPLNQRHRGRRNPKGVARKGTDQVDVLADQRIAGLASEPRAVHGRGATCLELEQGDLIGAASAAIVIC